MFDIAVILVHYNSGTLTADCVKSIIKSTSNTLNYQIIIVDNCSEYEDYQNLKQVCETIDSPNIQLVRSKINTGFGGGNMIGVQHANAKYLAFINNDTLFINDCLNILKDNLEKNNDIGIAGGQSFKPNGDFMISLDHFASPAREIFGRSFLEKINPKQYPKRKKRYIEPVKVNFVPGSFMFIRSEDFTEVGGFDTNIFLYYEETDLCKRLRKKGKYAYLIPSAEFIHYHGASTEKSIAIKKELRISLFYIMLKHYGIAGYFSVFLFLLIKYFFSSIFKPKNWPVFFLLLKGAPLSDSLKLKQKIATN
ncbi:glycosyltransferase family 2 protein [Flavobacterium alkalisoli]|uniref:glycosyltransferase family 2 protein n=1 Tax=Flavobacterium alkalisoli TaxID=2602769 RepID=UPI003A9124FD